MAQKIALFNHKSSVSKTTTTFNLGWMLAAKGKRVILVDTDPQCNLTGMCLGGETEKAQERIESIIDVRFRYLHPTYIFVLCPLLFVIQ